VNKDRLDLGPCRAWVEVAHIIYEIGAGEGIRAVDANLGKEETCGGRPIAERFLQRAVVRGIPPLVARGEILRI
jgi:hypothetical protein